jgi:hypothetical protein
VAIAAAGAIVALVALVRDGDAQVKVKAAGALRNLADGSTKSKSRYVAAMAAGFATFGLSYYFLVRFIRENWHFVCGVAAFAPNDPEAPRILRFVLHPANEDPPPDFFLVSARSALTRRSSFV